ncbi:MAG: hypothetical protein ABI905_05835 [Betaproteobacteria bacterium]
MATIYQGWQGGDIDSHEIPAWIGSAPVARDVEYDFDADDHLR